MIVSGSFRLDPDLPRAAARIERPTLPCLSDPTPVWWYGRVTQSYEYDRVTSSYEVAAYLQPLAGQLSWRGWRGWRNTNGTLRLRSVFHHREDRIRAHIQLCWLALLLIRVTENTTNDTWRNIRHELDRMHLVTLATPHGQLAQRSATTPGQQAILHALDLPEPPKFLDFTLPNPS